MFHVTDGTESVIVDPKEFYDWMSVAAESESVTVRYASALDILNTPRAALQWVEVPAPTST